MSENSFDRRPPLSLGQLDRGGDPLLIPVTPGSSVEEIARLVREAGGGRVELLVPDSTDALRSVDGARALREAALDSGIRLTIFTADDGIAAAAHAAGIEVVGVGAKVAAPRQAHGAAGSSAAQPGAAEYTLPPGQAPVASDRLFELDVQPMLDLPGLSYSQPEATMPGAAADDRDFLSRLDAFDQRAVDAPAPEAAEPNEPPRVQRSSEGALLFDAAGDLGVPRPAGDEPALPLIDPEADEAEEDYTDELTDEYAGAFAPADAEQEALALTTPLVAAEHAPQQEPPAQPSKPSLLAALFGFLPSRGPGRVPRATERPTTRPVPKQALSARMAGATAPASRPGAAPAGQPRLRRRGIGPSWLLVAVLILVLGGAGMLVAAQLDWRSAAGSVIPGVAPELAIEPPARSTEAVPVSDAFVQLVDQPVSDPSAITVQGIVLSVPVTVGVEGTATTTALTPFTRASGTLLFSNPSSQPITIPAGTPVQANGLEFTFDQDLTVGGAVSDFAGTRNGQGQARLTAVLPGAQGNIDAGTIANVPGYTGGDGPLRVLQDQPFSGGGDAEVLIVTPDDVSRLLPDLLTRLYAKGVQDIDAAVANTPGFELVSNEGSSGLPGRPEATAPISPTQELLAQVQLGDFEVFPAIGQVVDPELNGTFRVSMSRVFEALASPAEQPIDEQLRRAIANQRNLEGGSYSPEEVQITGWRRGEGGLRVDAVITPRAGYVTVPPERVDEIAASLRGLPVDQARAELDRLQQQGLIGAYTLPDDWESVPEGVVVRLTEPDAPAGQQ